MIRSHTILTLSALMLALALPTPGWAAAENVLSNGDFDSIVAPWALFPPHAATASLGWSAVDVQGSPASGSLLLENRSPDAIGFMFAEVCLPAEEGEPYRFGFSSRVPGGQTPSGDVASSFRFFPSHDCSGPSSLHQNGRRVREVGSWQETEIGPLTAPDGARSLLIAMGLRKTEALDGTVIAHFDAAYLVKGEDEPEPEPDPEPPPEGWFTDPTFPGFRFNVLITAGADSRPGTPEPSCLPETVCVSGALPGRVEILLRIIGPRPNGYLWPTLFRASTARFDVWIEQKGTDVVKHYVLEAAERGSSELSGLFDREGFLP